MPSLNTKLATAPNVSANYVLKATTSTTIGNSLIFDNGTGVGINTSTVPVRFTIANADTRIEFDQLNSTTSYLEAINTGRTTTNFFSMYTRGLNIWTRPSWTGTYAQTMTITDAGYINIANNTAQLLPISAGNFQILGGMYYNGSNLIASNGDGCRLLFSGGNFQFNTFTGATVGNSVSDTERMRITSGGQILINRTTASGYRLEVNGDIFFDKSDGTYIALGYNTSVKGYLGIASQIVNGGSTNDIGLFASNNLSFATGGSNAERMRITSNGYTKITNGGAFLGGTYHEFVNSTTNNYITTFNNTSASPFGIYIVYPNTSPNSGSSNEFIWCVDSTNSKFIVWSNGTASNRTGTYGTISSDRRLKENITEATSKLDDLMGLRVVNFNLTDDTDKKKQIGFIAQEFKEVFPSLVYEKDTREYDDNGNVTKGLEDSLGLNVGMEFAILVKAIQELNQKLQDQQQTINSLINR
jgi:hypothetical protein